MKIIAFLGRAFEKIMRMFRRLYFNSYTNNHSNVYLVGKVTLINRNLYIGDNVVIYLGCMFFGDGKIVIGDNVSIGNNTIIYSSKDAGVTIGNDTQIAAHCYIIDTDHGTNRGSLIREQKNQSSEVIIGNDCWLGTGVKVLKGSRIEDGAVIGAMSLVKGTIEHNSISIGIPARHYKFRND